MSIRTTSGGCSDRAPGDGLGAVGGLGDDARCRPRRRAARRTRPRTSAWSSASATRITASRPGSSRSPARRQPCERRNAAVRPGPRVAACRRARRARSAIPREPVARSESSGYRPRAGRAASGPPSSSNLDDHGVVADSDTHRAPCARRSAARRWSAPPATIRYARVRPRSAGSGRPSPRSATLHGEPGRRRAARARASPSRASPGAGRPAAPAVVPQHAEHRRGARPAPAR